MDLDYIKAQKSLRRARRRLWQFRKFKNFRSWWALVTSQVRHAFIQKSLWETPRKLPEAAFFYSLENDKDLLGMSMNRGHGPKFCSYAGVPSGTKTEKQIQHVPQEMGVNWQDKADDWIKEIYG